MIPNGRFLDNYYKDYDPGSLPSELYVEGISTTPAGPTVDIAILYRVGELEVDQVDIDLIVLEVDQDMVGVDDTSQKTEEITPGGFIALNSDDDDDDGVIDYDDGYNKDGVPGNDDDSNPDEDDLVKLTLNKVWPTDLTGNVTLKAIAGGAKIKIWGSQTKGGTPITLPETYDTPSDLPEELWVEGIEASSSVRDITLALEYTIGGHTFADNINMTVVKIFIKNPVNPTKGANNDSDDFFFRGPSENDVKVYYDFLPTDITATSVKLLIKESDTTLREITLSTTPGSNLLAQWNGKNTSGNYYDKWDFRAVIEVVINGTTLTSNEHPIADLLYKHRPLVYIHSSEFSGPVAAEFMMDHADLYDRSEIPDEKVADDPLSFSDLSSHDTTDYYQNLYNAYRQSGAGTHEVYCRGTTASGHAFLQYWQFEPSSSLPDLLTFYHEGDWEMFQIAVKLDTSAEELKPIAITGSQHYYGQTIRWAETGNGPASQNQDYVGKSGHQPKVYVARETHATYFRNGDFRTRSGSANHGDQYEEAPTIPHTDDETGGNSYSYTLKIFHNSMISHWNGNWGEDGLPLVPHDDGPPSPRYRVTAVNVWTDPKGFNNYYRKRVSYPSGAYAHPDTNIP